MWRHLCTAPYIEVKIVTYVSEKGKGSLSAEGEELPDGDAEGPDVAARCHAALHRKEIKSIKASCHIRFQV